jgi:hypothetical protein
MGASSIWGLSGVESTRQTLQYVTIVSQFSLRFKKTNCDTPFPCARYGRTSQATNWFDLKRDAQLSPYCAELPTGGGGNSPKDIARFRE